jgi:hypothetical protein
MRFDDLDPLPAEISQHRRADAARRLGASAAAAWRRLTPAVSAASAASRRSALRLAAIARTLSQAGRAQLLPPLLAVFRNGSRQTRVLAAGIAALVAMTGVSAGVVASRGSGGVRPVPTRSPLAIASSRAVAPVIAAPAVAMTLVPDEDPSPASPSIATVAPTPGPRKRKHAKAPGAQPARANALSKSSRGPSARPISGR